MSDVSSSPLTVVVVDDNRDAADTLSLLFHVMGHKVHVAYDAATGSKLVLEMQPDLAIFDLDLPDGNGCEALASLLALNARLKALFVCLTGRSTREAKQRCMEVGFHRFFVKPISGIEFEALIGAAQQRRASDSYVQSTP